MGRIVAFIRYFLGDWSRATPDCLTGNTVQTGQTVVLV